MNHSVPDPGCAVSTRLETARLVIRSLEVADALGGDRDRP